VAEAVKAYEDWTLKILLLAAKQQLGTNAFLLISLTLAKQ